MPGRVGHEDLAVRHRRDPVDLVDTRGRVGLGVPDRQDRVDLVARADLDLVAPADLDPVDHRRRHTGLGVSTARVVPRWAAPTMRLTASVHPTRCAASAATTRIRLEWRASSRRAPA